RARPKRLSCRRFGPHRFRQACRGPRAKERRRTPEGKRLNFLTTEIISEDSGIVKNLFAATTISGREDRISPMVCLSLRIYWFGAILPKPSPVFRKTRSVVSLSRISLASQRNPAQIPFILQEF